MPAFHYEALKMSDRAKISGLINAETEKEARELLREQDLVPTKLQIVQTQSTLKFGVQGNPVTYLLNYLKGISSKERIAFTRNMAMMSRSGIPVTEALLYFENYVSNPKLRHIISQIRKDILGGKTFSAALARHPKVFDDVYVNVTRAGESSGELDETLGRLTEMLIKTERIRTKIISASVYPCIVLGIVCIVLLIMFLVVIPTFVDIYKQMGVELPLLTQIMVAISNALKNGWFISFPILGFSLWGVIKYLRSPSGKRMIDNIILKVPILGPLMQYVYNSRFISTLAVSFRAGLPITEALALAASTVSHSKMRSAFQRVNLKIQAGQSLVVSLSQTNYVPELVLIMISTGQESGELDKMLATAYDYLEEEVNHRVEILMTFMEPALLLVLGVVIGFVAMAIYLPMFGVYENL